jgi:hypothetical protein
MDKLSRAWNGCWKKLWPEAVKDLQGAPKQQDEIKNIPVLACKVLGELFADFDENGIVHNALNFHTADLTEKDLEQPTTLNEPDDDDDSDTVVERPQLSK